MPGRAPSIPESQSPVQSHVETNGHHYNDAIPEEPVQHSRKGRLQEIARTLIGRAKALGANLLDLSRKELDTIPKELFELTHLEYLYLEGNNLTSLPDEFFDLLPRLKWLDLRTNRLSSLPAVFLGRHQNLRTLLVDDNQLSSLPPELGWVRSLQSIHLSGNPLEFPPSDVIAEGTKSILNFLRDLMVAKTSAGIAGREYTYMTDEGGDSDSSEDWTSNVGSRKATAKHRRHPATDDSNKDARKKLLVRKTGSPCQHILLNGPVEEDLGIETQKVLLNNPKSYTEARQNIIERFSRSSHTANSSKTSGKASDKYLTDWNVPPSAEYQEEKQTGERRQARLKEHKEKQEAILQRRRDEELLKNWRDESKKLQQKKYVEVVQRGSKDFADTAEQSPYGVDKEHLKMMSNEDRLKEFKPQPRVRKLSPRSRQRVEDERLAKDRELEKKIKEHTAKMMDRRKAPKGDPKQEMETAKRELQIVKTLQGELMGRYKQLKQWSSG